MFKCSCSNTCKKHKKNKPGQKLNYKKLVLAGNPNAGKSVFFNYFTGMYVDVSNYPGTTLDISQGYFNEYKVYDTPGVYGISSFNDEERVARDVILSADLVLNVVNAVYLERDLFLTQQIIDTGIPVIVALNMTDEAKNKGIMIDVEKLEKLLGVPVIATIATRREGLDKVAKQLHKAKPGNTDELLQSKIAQLIANNQNIPKGDALLILEGDDNIARRYDLQPLQEQNIIYNSRRQRVNAIIKEVVTYNERQISYKDRKSVV